MYKVIRQNAVKRRTSPLSRYNDIFRNFLKTSLYRETWYNDGTQQVTTIGFNSLVLPSGTKYFLDCKL